MVSLSSIMVTKNDGSSPTSVCVDPVATNYKTSGPTCKYKPVPAGKTGLLTNTPFGMYMSDSGASKKIFINFLGTGSSLAAGSPTLPAAGKDLPTGYLFALTRNKCISRSEPPPPIGTKGEQLYYGDYVQIGAASIEKTGLGVELYFNPGNGQNLFTNKAGDCTNTSWQTFQILHVDSAGKVSTNGNNPVLVGDNISLVSINTAANGPKAGTAIQIGSKFATAGLTSAALPGAPAPQHSTETKMMGDHYMSHTEFAMYANSELKSIFTVDNLILLILILVVLYFIWFKFIKKK